VYVCVCRCTCNDHFVVYVGQSVDCVYLSFCLSCGRFTLERNDLSPIDISVFGVQVYLDTIWAKFDGQGHS